MEIPYIISFASRTVLYVDTNSGNDGNNGTTWALAKATVQSASDAGADEIILRNSDATARHVAGRIRLMSETSPKELRIIGEYVSLDTDQAPIIGPGDLKYASDFSKTDGQDIVYECAFTDASIYAPFAVNPEELSLTDGEAGKIGLVSQASIALVNSNPGSYYLDDPGDKLYVSLPDSSATYFANGGAIWYCAGELAVDIRIGNILHLENIHIWGCLAVKGSGRIFARNIVQRFAYGNGIATADSGSILIDGADIGYNCQDNVSAKAQGFIGIKNAVLSHCGTVYNDQCLTGHQLSVIDAENIIAHDAGGPIVELTDGAKLYLKNFYFANANHDEPVIRLSRCATGLINDGFCTGGLGGLSIRDTASAWAKDARFKFKNVDFVNTVDGSGYDISVLDGIEMSVILENCKYTAIDPDNDNVEIINTRRAEVDSNGRGDISKIKGSDATNQIRDSVVDDSTRFTGASIAAILADSNELQSLIASSKIAAQIKGTDDIDLSATQKASIVTAIKAMTGFTAGGTWTYQEVVKAIAAYLLGTWQDKSGDPTTQEILDAEDDATVILEIKAATTSPYKATTKQ